MTGVLLLSLPLSRVWERSNGFAMEAAEARRGAERSRVAADKNFMVAMISGWQ